MITLPTPMREPSRCNPRGQRRLSDEDCNVLKLRGQQCYSQLGEMLTQAVPVSYAVLRQFVIPWSAMGHRGFFSSKLQTRHFASKA